MALLEAMEGKRQKRAREHSSNDPTQRPVTVHDDDISDARSNKIHTVDMADHVVLPASSSCDRIPQKSANSFSGNKGRHDLRQNPGSANTVAYNYPGFVDRAHWMASARRLLRAQELAQQGLVFLGSNAMASSWLTKVEKFVHDDENDNHAALGRLASLSARLS